MKKAVVALLIATILLGMLSVTMNSSTAIEPTSTVHVKTVVITSWIDLQTFDEKLQKLKRIGVDAIFYDVAWEDVERHRGTFDWDYNIRCTEAIARAGLLYIPQISVQMVPTWVWRDYPDAKFVNESNETSEEYMSYWHPQTKPLIQRFYSEFFTAFKNYTEMIYGVYVSVGGWSELAYPIFPRFAYWGYDPYAKADFRNRMMLRYVTIETANQRWDTSFSNWTEVNPPLPDTSHKNMWSDFLGWYNSTLVEHGDWVLNLTRAYYDGWVGIHFPMSVIEEIDLKLGHLDYDAIFSTVAKYEAVPSYTFVEHYETAIKFSTMAEKYDLDAWSENALQGADLQSVLRSLTDGGYEAFCYIRMEDPWSPPDLFDAQGNPTPRFYEFSNFIRQWDPAPAAIFEHTSPVALEPTIFNASESAPIGGSIVSYEWDFGDNTTMTVTNPIVTHVYDKGGNYTVTLNVTDSEGLWNTVYQRISVKSPDINSDDSVNVRDLVLVSRAFGVWPGWPNWDSRADLNNDRMIDAFDMFPVANHFKHSVDAEQAHYNLAVDFNSDGMVNCTDIVILAEAYGSTPKDTNWNPMVDLNNDSIINQTDLDIVYNVFSFLTVDFDGNNQINIIDITRVATAFNSYPGHEKWNVKVDVDDSLTINIIDITKIAKEFGKQP